MSTFLEWAIPLGLYALGFWHHAWAMGRHHATQALEARQQRRLEMLREAIALAKYGAHKEAHELIDEAVALGEATHGKH